MVKTSSTMLACVHEDGRSPIDVGGRENSIWVSVGGQEEPEKGNWTKLQRGCSLMLCAGTGGMG